MGLKGLILKIFPFWEAMVVLKGLIMDSFHLGRV